ncbi:hypothetical protein [Micromonospora sp. WMMD964]|uniref:hypothetical protein n=1 Tax=Micromonospora sp. WMMD964 TaxID=3016091 RepID=UPI00249A1FEA|nr:hypothetical protein [Micromonospora sp. WMMD964]WFF00200.1 hypothetical protein O7616_25400 [Micromonospora sp. WMMD964]
MEWDYEAYRLIDPGEAERRFSLSVHVGYPYADPADQQEIRLFEGDWTVDGDLMSAFDFTRPPYHVIIDGDLTHVSELTWVTDDRSSFFLVCGDVEARAVTLGGVTAGPEMVISGSLVAYEGVLGDCDDPGGRLVVHGRTHTPIALVLDAFVMDFRRSLDGVAVGEPSAFVGSHPVAGYADALRPGLIVDGEFDREAIWEDLSAGGAASLLWSQYTPRSD